MIKLNSKIFIAGHEGLVGSAIYRKLKIKGYRNIIIADRKKLDLTDQNKVIKFLKAKNYKFDKKTKTHSYLISKIKKFEIAVDANDPPSDLNSQNYQAGCLSFEFLYNGKKIISNCGSAHNFSGDLPYLSQTTAAHSALTINDTSSCLFQKNPLVRTFYGNSLIQKLKVYKKGVRLLVN